jgi:hypothetical protein
MTDEGQPRLHRDREHFQASHHRWADRRLRRQNDPSYQDEWWQQQCGGCRFWIPLTGIFGDDYGACSNPASAADGLVRFEHDGCEAYEQSTEWGRAT